MGKTIKDIAKEANVSIATVSRVINNKYEGVGEETRERIKKIMKEMDYRPSGIARGLVTKKTYTLGLLVPDISNPFFPDIVKGVEDKASEMGYNIILCNSDDNTEKEITSIRILKEKCVDGIVCIGANNEDSKGMELLKEYNIPFVHIDRSSHADCLSVYSDGGFGMYIMTKFLIEKGHKNIAYIKGSVRNERLEGFLKAIGENGLSFDNDLIYNGNYRLQGGIDGAKYLLDKNKEFTAIICENDLMAVGVIEYLEENNIKVPCDISVTGYDDIYISNIITPKLTTIHQDTYGMGKISVEMLLKSIDGETLTKNEIILEPKLIVRKSVKSIL